MRKTWLDAGRPLSAKPLRRLSASGGSQRPVPGPPVIQRLALSAGRIGEKHNCNLVNHALSKIMFSFFACEENNTTIPTTSLYKVPVGLDKWLRRPKQGLPNVTRPGQPRTSHGMAFTSQATFVETHQEFTRMHPLTTHALQTDHLGIGGKRAGEFVRACRGVGLARLAVQ